MKLFIRIYNIYLKYIAPEDIHVYSIDEVFMDVTDYLDTYGMTAKELAMTIMKDVLVTTGITATAGIGTNLYLSKIAMDMANQALTVILLEEIAHHRRCAQRAAERRRRRWCAVVYILGTLHRLLCGNGGHFYKAVSGCCS